MSGNGIRRGFLETSEGQLHYRRFGQGKPFVLMMTLPFNTTMFHPLMQALGQHYECFAVDLLGQGDSDARTRSLTVEDNAKLIWEGLDALGLGPIRVLGGHFTGKVATEMAILRPNQVDKLFLDGMVAWSLEEGAEFSKGFPPTPFWMSAKYVAGEWEYVEALLHRLDPELVMSNLNTATLAGLGFSFMKSRLGGPGGQGMFDYDFCARAKLLRVPTVLIGSPSDTLQFQHEKAFAAIPNGEQYQFETVNPLYQFDKPERAEEYAAMLRTFLPA